LIVTGLSEEDDQRMAVRLAAREGLDADGGIGARLVFHDDALADAVLQILGDDARGQIDAAAGRIGHDDSDCSIRKCLRLRGCGDADDREQRDQPARHASEC
jgi:hypothetical protein